MVPSGFSWFTPPMMVPVEPYTAIPASPFPSVVEPAGFVPM